MAQLEFMRDPAGRPLVSAPNNPLSQLAYERPSSLVKQTFAKPFFLEDWEKRTIARAVDRFGLFDPETGEERTPKQLFAIGGGWDKANRGTDYHKALQDYFETGASVKHYERLETVPALLEKEDMKPVLFETKLVNDEQKLAGSADFFVSAPNGLLTVCDLKTGRMSIEHEAQLAAYAQMQFRYHVQTGKREPIRLNTSYAYIVQLPLYTKTLGARLYRIDLNRGHELLADCLAMRTKWGEIWADKQE
jgi:hypothetical protein